jgi:hypothetical protein
MKNEGLWMMDDGYLEFRKTKIWKNKNINGKKAIVSF